MNNIRKYRAFFKLRQSDLAKEIGVTRQTINAVENGKTDPSLSLAFKLAKVFNCKIEELFENN